MCLEKIKEKVSISLFLIEFRVFSDVRTNMRDWDIWESA